MLRLRSFSPKASCGTTGCKKRPTTSSSFPLVLFKQTNTQHHLALRIDPDTHEITGFVSMWQHLHSARWGSQRCSNVVIQDVGMDIGRALLGKDRGFWTCAEFMRAFSEERIEYSSLKAFQQRYGMNIGA